MNSIINHAVDRLNSILPLKRQQQTLSKTSADAYQRLLRSFVGSGRALPRQEMEKYTDNVDAVLRELKSKDLITCDANNNPSGAYPFTQKSRPYRISVNGVTINAMCALDALAISPMFQTPTQIESHCAISHAPLHLQQDNHALANQDELADVYFAINWSAANPASCCAESLCTEMIFIKGHTIAQDWLSIDAHNRQLFTLAEAIEFASAFFVPLLQNTPR